MANRKYTPRVVTSCFTCGNQIIKPPSLIRKRNFCPGECYWVYRRTLRGEKNARWKGGLKNRPCAQCGSDVLRKSKELENYEKSFCSLACQSEWKRINSIGHNSAGWRGGPSTRTCTVCGVEFQRANWQPSKFCSQACYTATLKGTGNPNHRHGDAITVEKVCPTCGIAFSAPNFKTFCSRACVPKSGADNSMFTTGYSMRREMTCQWCGEKFMGMETAETCSRKCKAQRLMHRRFHGPDAEKWRARYSEMSSGPNNRNWRDGRALMHYGPGWTDNLRKKIRSRDGNACVACHATKRLQIHHRNESKTDHSEENLITLCQSCHVHVHRGKLSILP